MYNGSNCDRKPQLSDILTEPLNPPALSWETYVMRNLCHGKPMSWETYVINNVTFKIKNKIIRLNK